MTKEYKINVPENAPKEGEIYKHYKGDLYEMVLLSENSDPDELFVVYKAKYENPAFPYFSRSLKSFLEEVEWQGEKVKRFIKVS